jgi:hypothetical protein
VWAPTKQWAVLPTLAGSLQGDSGAALAAGLLVQVIDEVRLGGVRNRSIATERR